ncbi:MAG: hypothetical protein R3Y51_08265 [Rikenellaceae bacterium]
MRITKLFALIMATFVMAAATSSCVATTGTQRSSKSVVVKKGTSHSTKKSARKAKKAAKKAQKTNKR